MDRMNKLSACCLSVALLICRAEEASADTFKLTVTTDILIASASLCIDKDEGKLSVNSSCLAIVRAADSSNDVGVIVDQGEQYTVTVLKLGTFLDDSQTALPSEQVWYDSSIHHLAPCGKPGNLFMKIVAFLKKATNSEWFSLIAEIEGVPHDLCMDKSFRATQQGKLIMYANDAHGFFGNNSGNILIKIDRNEDYL